MQITDRSKDVIKSGGEWISSIDLENIAIAHPAIAEAAVIGVHAPEMGRAADRRGGEEAGRRSDARRAARVLRGQDREVVDARRRRVRRRSCRTPRPASCRSSRCGSRSRTTSCLASEMNHVLVERQGAIAAHPRSTARTRRTRSPRRCTRRSRRRSSPPTRDPGVRVMLIDGAGDAFTAGNDLQDFLAHAPQGRAAAGARLPAGVQPRCEADRRGRRTGSRSASARRCSRTATSSMRPKARSSRCRS